MRIPRGIYTECDLNMYCLCAQIYTTDYGVSKKKCTRINSTRGNLSCQNVLTFKQETIHKCINVQGQCLFTSIIVCIAYVHEYIIFKKIMCTNKWCDWERILHKKMQVDT